MYILFFIIKKQKFPSLDFDDGGEKDRSKTIKSIYM